MKNSDHQSKQLDSRVLSIIGMIDGYQSLKEFYIPEAEWLRWIKGSDEEDRKLAASLTKQLENG